MTDEIRITRRVALPIRFEFYEMEIKIQMDWAKVVADGIDEIIDTFENKVSYIRENMGEPSPEISPKTSSDDTPFDNLLVWDGPNRVRLIGFLKEKDKWIEINTYLKGLGFKWTKDGSDSRWER